MLNITIEIKVSNFALNSSLIELVREGTPYNRLYEGASPERCTFFRLQVYEREVISLVEVYERVGKSVILVRKITQKSFRRILWL